MTPWSALIVESNPFYPKDECRRRPFIDLQRLFRRRLAQQCFGLPDGGFVDEIYDSEAIRRFVGIDRKEDVLHDGVRFQ